MCCSSSAQGVAEGSIRRGRGAADWAACWIWGCRVRRAQGQRQAQSVRDSGDGVAQRKRLQSKSAEDLIAVASTVEKALRASGRMRYSCATQSVRCR